MDKPTPQQQIAGMVTGYWISQSIYVAAKLGIADLLKPGARTAEELAPLARVQPEPLYRLLRALASLGIFKEDERRRFGLTPLADCLRSDAAGSQRALAITSGEDHYQAWGELLYSVQTGKEGFDKVYGMPVFDYYGKHPELAKMFDETMVAIHGQETAAMLDGYDFSGIAVLADVGGGNGSLLGAVLKKYPAIKGILFDLPAGPERTAAHIQSAGLANRCEVVGGSFFDFIPASADAYLMRHIIHDWEDEKALRILRNIHRAMKPDGKLLLVESVIAAGNEPQFAKLLDLTMLVIPGGKERTKAEYETLFKTAGFRLTRIVPTKSEICVIEAAKAG